MRGWLVAVLVAWQVGCGAPPRAAGMESFNPSVLDGRWRIVATLPLPFEVGCGESALRYGPAGDTHRSLTFTCTRNARPVRIRGCLSIDGSHPAEAWMMLWGRAIGSARAEHHVLAADPGGAWLLVGPPSRSFLWLLTPAMTVPSGKLATALRRAEELGYQNLARRLLCIAHGPVGPVECEAARSLI